jgi:hypothetical protein
MLRNRRQASAPVLGEPAKVATIDDQIAKLKARAKVATEEATKLERELQTFPARMEEARSRYNYEVFNELREQRLSVFRQFKAARIESLQLQVEIAQLKEPVLKERLDRLRVESEELEKRSEQARVDFLSASYAQSGIIRGRLAREEELELARCMKLTKVAPFADDYEDEAA